MTIILYLFKICPITGIKKFINTLHTVGFKITDISMLSNVKTRLAIIPIFFTVLSNKIPAV